MVQTISIPTSRRWGAMSPLRYPGGKAALAGFFADVIQTLGLKSGTYVEPYAGGAGAGVALLREGIVDNLVINDFDKAVYSFWYCVTTRTDEFIDKVETVPLSIEEWRRQKAIYQAGDITQPMQLGFSFFYLNRTNRSGVLKAGVIGGYAQKGSYLIDARFNRKTLVEKISAIGKLSSRIIVSRLDGRSVIKRYRAEKNTFLYIDPPYVKAGNGLYMNPFTAHDHISLAEILNESLETNWILTYDVSPFILGLYSKRFQRQYSLTYSSNNSGKSNELIIAPEKMETIINGISL